jgi:hypothetical protein
MMDAIVEVVGEENVIQIIINPTRKCYVLCGLLLMKSWPYNYPSFGCYMLLLNISIALKF